MSKARWGLDVTATRGETYEAMILVGAAIMRGHSRLWTFVHALFVYFCAPLGATLIFWVAVRLGGGPVFEDLPAAAVPLTLLGFFAAGVWLAQQPYVLMAELSVRSRFGRGYSVLLDENGMTLVTQNSMWQTGWADVSAVCGGKTTLAVGISGIAIALPHGEFDGPDDVAQALEFAQQHWQAAQ